MKETEKRFWDEIQKASNRIGLSAEKVTEWLLNFAQIDLEGLSEGQWLDLRAELEVFFACGPPKSDHDMADRHYYTHPNKEGTWSPILQRKGTVPEVQKIIKKALKDLVESGVAIFEPLTVIPCISRDRPLSLESESNIYRLPPPSESPKDRFLSYAIDLLETVKNRIHPCFECKRFFLGYRFQQHFCSTACQNRVNQRKYRERRQGKNGKSIIIVKPTLKIPSAHFPSKGKK